MKHSDLSKVNMLPKVARGRALFEFSNGSMMFELMNGDNCYCNPFDISKHHVMVGDWVDMLVKPNVNPPKTAKSPSKYITIGVIKIIDGDEMTAPLSKVASHLVDGDLGFTTPLQKKKPTPPKPVEQPRNFAAEIQKLLMTVKCMATPDIQKKITGINCHHSDMTEGQIKQWTIVATAIEKLHRDGELFCLKAFRGGNQTSASRCFYGRNIDDIISVIDPCYGKQSKYDKLAAYGNVTRLASGS